MSIYQVGGAAVSGSAARPGHNCGRSRAGALGLPRFAWSPSSSPDRPARRFLPRWGDASRARSVRLIIGFADATGPQRPCGTRPLAAAYMGRSGAPLARGRWCCGGHGSSRLSAPWCRRGRPYGRPFLRHCGPLRALGRAAGSGRERVGSRRSFLCGFLRSAPAPLARARGRPGSAPPPRRSACRVAGPARNLVAGARGGQRWGYDPAAPAHTINQRAAAVFGTFSPPPPRPGAPAGGSRGARG